VTLTTTEVNWNWKEEAFDSSFWRNQFGRGCGLIAVPMAQWMLRRQVGKVEV